ncbi:protein kinase domain-containing protein [Streptomyces sp. TR06-5]|uniref:protein kinase domain-containing protein n=1 Tax=unclassified Streptomyces TaxID=2593676 RepID=UPI0039A14D48
MSDDGAQSAQYVGRAVGNGRFQLQSLLGEGGMASVYLAYDSVLDRQVAVKTLHTDLGREQSFRERFRREAQSVAKLTHTNIVSVFDSGEDEIDGAPVPYIVMEYVEGKPLRTVLDEDIAQFGAMPADKALKITGDVLAALEVSHELGLVHRDIKPGNVMVTKRGVVKVMDFGIARAMQSGVTSMTQTGMVVGTPQYLSPEQALGRGVDARSDLYSVGILLFELLTGRLPFDADSPLAIAYAHVQEEAVAPSTVNRAVSPAVDALVARTLRKNPDDRFPSAEAMHEECDRLRNSGTSGGAAPVIVGNGPAPSGAGVGQAVFPPVGDGSTPPPPPGSAQPPFAGQYAAGYGPSTPPPTGPMGQPGFSTPAPAPYAQQGANTPPPYGMGRPGGPPVQSRGGKSSNGVVIGSTIAAVVVVVVIVIAVSLINGGSKSDPEARGTTSAPSPVQSRESGTGGGGGEPTQDGSDVDGFKPEDTSRTVEATECTEARDSYTDEDKLNMPGLTFNTFDSVKECLDKAGWELGKVTYEDENVWGKNMVLDQSPNEYDAFDPDSDDIDLTVSTGMPKD